MRIFRPSGTSPACRPATLGFTLIELMVTITLLGILISLSLPSFTTWIRNSQVRTVSEALQTGLRTAQAESVRRNRQVVMSFTNDANPTLNPTTVANGKNWSIQTVASPFINNNVTEFVRAGVLTDVASGVSITGAPKAICFNADGRLMAPTGSAATADCAGTPAAFQVLHPASDRTLNVTVAVGGQVRMCDPKRPALSTTSPDGC